MSAAVELRGVSKCYVKYDDAPMLTTTLLRLTARTRRDRLWALRDVDLTVEDGECVGVIGRNGSGKSTLLQLLGGITAPTRGSVTVRGRVAPLISVGVGFHPELTGRDNVFLNGTILGMTRREIERRFDDIVAFAEIGDFVDTPVKFYSSGMQVRLGFAVAVQADPQVLLVDEVLAVGDFAFQVKCLQRIEEIRQGGASVLLVSHNLPTIERLCPRTIVLHEGTERFNGPTPDAIATLHSLLDPADPGDSGAEPVEAGVAEVVDFAVLDDRQQPVNRAVSGEALTATVTVEAKRDIAAPFVGLTIDGPRGDTIYHRNNSRTPYPPMSAGERRVVEVSWQARFPTGSYGVRCFVGKVEPVAQLTVLSHATPVALYVTGPRGAHGVVDVSAEFGQPAV